MSWTLFWQIAVLMLLATVCVTIVVTAAREGKK